MGIAVRSGIKNRIGMGAGTRTWLLSDERGSIVSSSDDAGNLVAVNAYDEYGKPGASNAGRFQYTGQKWIGELGAYDYKARVYLPHLGIFAQTDPIGYEPSPNLYVYVLNDPVNLIDPLGLDETERCIGDCAGFDPSDIVITGQRIRWPVMSSYLFGSFDLQALQALLEPPIVITAEKKKPSPRSPRTPGPSV